MWNSISEEGKMYRMEREKDAYRMGDYGDRQAIIPQASDSPPPPAINHVNSKIKYTILVLSFFFWIVGGLFAAIGSYINTQIFDYHHLSKLAFVPGSIIIIGGAIIFVMSTFGVLGSYRENLCFLNAYKWFLILILFLEVFIGFVGFSFWPEVKKIVDIQLQRGIRYYTSDKSLEAMMDLIQRELKCCGHLTIDDWDSNDYFSCKNIESYKSCGVPWSCCHHKFYRNRHCGFGLRGYNYKNGKLREKIFMEGCLDVTFEFFKSNLKMIGGLAVASALPIIIMIFLIRKLIRQIMKHMNMDISKQQEIQYT